MVQGYARKKGVRLVDRARAAAAGPLPRSQGAPGDRQPAHERHRRLRARRDGHDPHRRRARRRGRPHRGRRHRLRASIRRSANGSSTRSSPPSRSARGPGWAFRSATASSRSTRARSTSSRPRAPARASRVRLPRQAAIGHRSRAAAGGRRRSGVTFHEARSDQLGLGPGRPRNGLRHPQDPRDRLRLDRHLRRPARHRRQGKATDQGRVRRAPACRS